MDKKCVNCIWYVKFLFDGEGVCDNQSSDDFETFVDEDFNCSYCEGEN